MKKFVFFILILSLTPVPAFSGVMLWAMRAELWQKNDAFQNFLYVQGIMDGMVFSNFTVHNTKLSMEITVEQYVKAIDTLYADYRNSLIPVPFLLKVVTIEIQGADKNTVQKELEAYRKQFSTVPK